MLNDPKLTVAALTDIITASEPSELSLPERCALLAAGRVLLGDIREHVDLLTPEDGYAKEKIGQVRWHLGAALGFDVDNGQPPSQHRSFALGSLDTLESLLVKMQP